MLGIFSARARAPTYTTHHDAQPPPLPSPTQKPRSYSTKHKYLGGATGVVAARPIDEEEALYFDEELVGALVSALREGAAAAPGRE